MGDILVGLSTVRVVVNEYRLMLELCTDANNRPETVTALAAANEASSLSEGSQTFDRRCHSS